MLEFTYWPSGEEETRLSAKQLLHRFDSGLGLQKTNHQETLEPLYKDSLTNYGLTEPLLY